MRSKRIVVIVKPHSSQTEIIDPKNGEPIIIKLTAVPVDGKANKQLIELLSKEWNITKTRMQIVKGLRSKKKIIEIL